MEQKALPEVCHIQYGYPFDSKRFSDKEGFPLIRIRDVVRGHTETFTTESCNDEYIVKKGDILIGMDGMFNVAKWKGNTAYLNQRVCKIEPNSSIVADYLFYYLPCALKKIENKTAFVTVKHLKAKQLNSILIPCPPVKEQKRIAQILDLLFYLICQKKKQLNYLDELVKSRFLEMFGEPWVNDKEFPCYSVGQVAESVTYGTSAPASDSGQYEYLRMNNLTDNGQLDLSDLKRIDMSDEQAEKYMVKKGDILFNRTNSIDLVGKTALFNLNNPMIIAGYLIRIRLSDKVNPVYFVAYMNMPYMKEKLRNIAKGAVNQANINSKELKSIQILIPPLSLQNEYCNFVLSIDKSKLAVQKSLDELEILKKSLMQTYFG
ncbi:restriction endonuclease subunit S [uncultured Dialister sp.]|uniref:restriction endonuclease subunit S n=1 Tax=uncultured Dialister sp. TaxID=278064 RepID=UPI002594A553|nr:restriction endonuclease subunit S [uncultured Dialister sp.]